MAKNERTQNGPEPVEETVIVTDGELADEQLDKVAGGGEATTISNLANMRHEMLKAVANNLRA